MKYLKSGGQRLSDVMVLLAVKWFLITYLKTTCCRYKRFKSSSQ